MKGTRAHQKSLAAVLPIIGAFFVACSSTGGDPAPVEEVSLPLTCGGVFCTRPPGSNGCVVSTCGISPTTGKRECQLALVKSTDFACVCLPGAHQTCPNGTAQTCITSGDAATAWSPPC